jgi:hypothetical protein
MMWANKALDRDPHHSFARELQAGACRRLGDLERYAEIVQRAGEVARELLSDVREVNFGEFYLVLQCAEVGDLDGAFEHLQRMFDAHDPVLVDLAVGPHWDSLRADPRFSQFLARMKLRPVL